MFQHLHTVLGTSQRPQSFLDRLRSYPWLKTAALGCVSSLLVALPAQAADNIRFRYGLFEVTVTRQELENYAETGEAEGGLKTVLSRLSPGIQAQLQTSLQARYPIDPILANRFSYTGSGVQLLTEAGNLVRTASGLNGFKGLRGALTLSASDPRGLTLLNFIEAFPTDIRIDIGQALDLANGYGVLLGQTQQVVEQLVAQTDAIATTNASANFSTLPDPRALGGQEVAMQTLTLVDEERDRTILTDFYTPVSEASDIPVIVVSNGLGAKRSRFNELGEHLASHGFAVALIDHPGSDRERLRDFYEGQQSENFEASEYVDRPLDVSFVLDELTRLNTSTFNNRLSPDQAGVFGYSFGGTTALALAGAEIDRDYLQQECDTRNSLYNISLLYQCRALDLPEAATTASFRDERVKAVYVFVPFSRSLYGPEGMAKVETPVLWEATDKDILTPLLIEQLPSYSWMTADNTSEDDQYLAITSGLPHARITLEVLNRITGEATKWEDIKPIAETYHHMLNTAFFQVHLAEDEDYRPYLQAQGAQYLTQEPYNLTWRDTPIPPELMGD